MPALSAVYDRINVIIDGQVRGVLLAPYHYVMLNAFSIDLDPIDADAVTVEGPGPIWIWLDQALASGVATLGEPFSEVRSIGTVGDCRLYGPDGLVFHREA